MRQSRIARNIRLGVKNLLLRKLRSVLTMLGVVTGHCTMAFSNTTPSRPSASRVGDVVRGYP